MNVNIRFQSQIKILLAALFFLNANISPAQDSVLNKYGLWVVKDVKTYQSTVNKNPEKRMVDVRSFIPDIILDLRYATTNNFMHKKLYPPITTTYLRLPAAKALQQVQNDLKEEGLALKIFDAYRPYSVTEKMWEPIQDERYVADPKKGSGHNRGGAVDLTIVDLKTNKELPMGTDFDNFTDSAHQTFTALPLQILQNRYLLKRVMEKHGFKALETEWWHFYLSNLNDFELLDIPFKKLSRLKD